MPHLTEAHEAAASASAPKPRSPFLLPWRDHPAPPVTPVRYGAAAVLEDDRLVSVAYTVVAQGREPVRIVVGAVRDAEGRPVHRSTLSNLEDALLCEAVRIHARHHAYLAAERHREELRRRGLHQTCPACEGAEVVLVGPEERTCRECRGEGAFAMPEAECAECDVVIRAEDTACLYCAALDRPLCEGCGAAPELHGERCPVAARLWQGAA